MPKRDQPNNEMLKGTLDMMILRTLILADAHGHTIAKVIERSSEDLLAVEEGSAESKRQKVSAAGVEHKQLGSTQGAHLLDCGRYSDRDAWELH